MVMIPDMVGFMPRKEAKPRRYWGGDGLANSFLVLRGVFEAAERVCEGEEVCAH